MVTEARVTSCDGVRRLEEEEVWHLCRAARLMA